MKKDTHTRTRRQTARHTARECKGGVCWSPACLAPSTTPNANKRHTHTQEPLSSTPVVISNRATTPVTTNDVDIHHRLTSLHPSICQIQHSSSPRRRPIPVAINHVRFFQSDWTLFLRLFHTTSDSITLLPPQVSLVASPLIPPLPRHHAHALTNFFLLSSRSSLPQSFSLLPSHLSYDNKRTLSVEHPHQLTPLAFSSYDDHESIRSAVAS